MQIWKNSSIAAIPLCLRIVALAWLTFGADGAMAQETPKIAIAGLYTEIPEFFGPTCHGAAGSVSYNVNRWLSAVGEISGCRGTGSLGLSLFSSSSPPPTTRTWFTYMAGPRVSYRRRLTPYAHVLFGGAHLADNSPYSVLRGNAFAMTIGIGVDLKLSDRFSVRLIQPEYLRTNFSGGFSREDARIQSGIVFGLK